MAEIGFLSVALIPRPPAPPRQKGVASKNAYANFSSGEVADVLALDGTSPPWNADICLSVREQARPSMRRRSRPRRAAPHADAGNG